MKPESKPNNPFVNYQAGLHYKEQGDYEKAIPVLKRAKELFPNYVVGPNPYDALVEIYLEQGNKDEAVRELKALTSRNGKNPATLKLLATLSSDLNDHSSTIAALDKILYISPFESDVHKKLAAAYMADGQFDRAVEELRILLKTEPQDLAGTHCDLANRISWARS